MIADATDSTSPIERPLDIIVLMGGCSSERDVSLLSGRAVSDALESLGHRVRREDIGPADLSVFAGPAPDVAFIAMHGEFGEDGQVQRLCEQAGWRYVGSGPQASALAMDKAASKERYRQAGLQVAPAALVDADTAEQAEAVDLPCVVKCVNGGSSVDVYICRDAAARRRKVQLLIDRYGRALVERFVAGREMTCGILGDRALPPIEIRAGQGFYDYHAKYYDDNTQYILDHGLDAATVERIERAARTAHEVLGCRHMSRSDFIVDDAGACWIIETNTIPGFTSHSLLPKSAAAVGIDFPRLCQRLVEMALQQPVSGDVTLKNSHG